MRYERGCDWSTIESSLLGDENTFKVYLASYWKDMTENSHLTLSAYALKKIATLVANEQMLWARYLKIKVLFLLYLSFHWRDLTKYSYLAFSTHALKPV